MRLKTFSLILFFALLLALSTYAQEPVEPLPTEVIPTTPPATETPIPTEPIVPTETPLPTATETAAPSLTPTATSTDTEAPVLTETPTTTATSELTLSPTGSYEFTATLTPSMTASLQPTFDPFATIEPPFTTQIYDNFDSGALGIWQIGAGWSLVANESGLALQAQNTIEPVIMGDEALYNVSIRLSAQLTVSPIRLFARNSVEGIYSASLDASGNVILYQGQEIIGSAAASPGIPGLARAFELTVVENFLRVRVDDIEVMATTVEMPLPAGQVGFAAVTTSEIPFTVDDVVVSWQETYERESFSFMSASTWSQTYYFNTGVQGWTLMTGKSGTNGIEDVNVGPTQYDNTANLTMQVTIPEGSTLTDFYMIPCIGGGSRHAYTSGFGYTLNSGLLPTPVNFGTDCVSGWGFGGLNITDQTSLVTIAAGNQVESGYIYRVTFAGTGNNPFTVAPPLPPEICGSGGGTETPDPETTETLTRCQIAETLAGYGVIVPEIYLQKVSGADFWTIGELEELLNGVQAAGQALREQSTVGYNLDQDAFRNILLFNPTTDWIEFKRSDNSVTTCSTNPRSPSEITSTNARATITCGGSNQFTQFTAVHELGHVFLHQTAYDTPSTATPIPTPSCPTPAFNTCINFPGTPGAPNTESLGWGDGLFVFGPRTFFYTREDIRAFLASVRITGATAEPYVAAFSYLDEATGTPAPEGEPTIAGPGTTAQTDWLRGERGWGSGASNQGACANNNGPSPTDFQQNPCTFHEWLAEKATLYALLFEGGNIQDAKLTELDEAGADMFLNWVYRSLNQGGFENASWSSNCMAAVAGTPPPYNPLPDICEDGVSVTEGNGPGDDRWNWMETRMGEFFAYFGW